MSTNTGAGAGDATANRRSSGDRQRNNSQRGKNQGRSAGQGSDKWGKPQSKKFIGKEEALGEDCVYQYTVGAKASDEFTQTTEAIVRYCSNKYKRGDDVAMSLADGKVLDVPAPDAPTDATDITKMTVWKMKLSMALNRAELLDSNLRSVYNLIKGQCTKAILEKVESQHGYGEVHSKKDPIGLLALIRGVMFNYNSRKYRAITLVEILKPDLVT